MNLILKFNLFILDEFWEICVRIKLIHRINRNPHVYTPATFHPAYSVCGIRLRFGAYKMMRDN